MAEQEIKFILSATGAEATQAHLNKTGKTADAMGKTVNKSSALGIAGMRGLEVVAADAGRAIGISGEAASVFGRVMGAVTRGVGSASLILGAVAVTGYGAYLAWKKLSGATSENTKETLRAADAAGKWVEQAAKEEVAARSLREEKTKLYKIEFDRNKTLLGRGIEEQTNAVIDSYYKLEKALNVVGDNLPEEDPFFRLIYGSKKKRQVRFEDLKYEYEKGLSDLQKMYKQEGLFSDDVKRSGGKDGADEEKARLTAIFDAKVEAANREWEFDQRIAEGKRAFDKAQLENFEQVERAKLQLKQQYDQALLATAGSALNAYAALSHKNAKLVFYAQKALAMAQVVADTGRAAMSAAATAAVLGPEAAAAASASMWTLGKINMAIIAASALAGPGGGGGGGGAPPALPTYNANPATGLPSSSDAGKTLNLTLVINGERRQAIEITQDIVQTLYDQNGAVGGLKVSVERSA